MTQEAIEISTTPPLPGLKLVQDVNKALQTIATDFAGPTDPAGLPGCVPYCTWADTGNMLLKRRNAANTAWEVEGELFTYKANRNGDAGEKFKASPATESGDVVTFDQAFGVGQAAQNVTASRSLSTVYTNTNSYPRRVSVFASSTTTNCQMHITVGSTRVTHVVQPNNGSGTACWAVVFPGETYEVTLNGGTLTEWWET